MSHAQSASIVVPASAAAADARARTTTFFAEGRERRIQLLIGAEHLRGLAGKRLTQLAFRKDIKYSAVFDVLRGSVATTLTIRASFSAVDPANPSLVFAENHGTLRRTVFRGVVTLPKVAAVDTRLVSTFRAVEAPVVTFQAPLVHEPNKTLVLDFVTSKGQLAGYEWVWPIDAVSLPKRGSTRFIETACWPSRSKPAAHVKLATLRPGMHIKVESVAPPSPVAAFLLVGHSDKLAFGSLPLPITIASPDCKLAVSPDLLFPTTFFSGATPAVEGATGTVVGTPQLRALYGASVYFQYLFLSAEQSGVRLRTSNAIEATFTKEVPTLGMSLVATMEPTAATGRIFLDFGPVMQLTGK